MFAIKEKICFINTSFAGKLNNNSAQIHSYDHLGNLIAPKAHNFALTAKSSMFAPFFRQNF